MRSSIHEKVATTIVAHLYFLILPFAIFSFASGAKAAAVNLGDGVRIVNPANVNSPTHLGTESRSVTPLGISNSVAIEMASTPNQRTTANSPLSNVNPIVIDTTLTASAMVMKSDVNQLIAIEPIDGAISKTGPKTFDVTSLAIPLKDVLPGGTYKVGSTYREDAQNSIPPAPRSATYFGGQIVPPSPFQGGPYKPDAAITPQSYTVSVTSNANPSIFGSSLSLTASINTPLGAAQSGSVTFTDNGVIVGIADVVAGTAVLPVSSTTNAQATLCAGAACLGPGTVVKYVSQLGCAYQDTDLMLGGGHDDTQCINAALASATAANPVLIWQDGKSLISGNGIQGPAGGNWGIIGSGANITTELITNCSIAGGIATLTTTANTLVAGQWVDLNNFTTCTQLNWALTQVLSTGLSESQFQVATSGTVLSTSENANASEVSGTGFFSSNGTGDLISNSIMPASWGCAVPAGQPPPRGSNILLQNFVLNARGYNNGLYCFNIDLQNINNIRIEHIVSYESPRFETQLNNVGNVVIEGSTFFKSRRDYGDNSDGIHVDGPANDLTFSDDHFRTGDDSVALNATEGYCGPINRVKWTNSTLDDSYDAIRIYNGDLDGCSNGLVPLVDTVYLDNISGSVYSSYIGIFGNSLSGLGGLDPAITNFQWNNSTITSTNPGSAEFWMTDNFGTMSFTNFTLDSPNASGIFSQDIGYGLITHVASLTLNNFAVHRTPLGSNLSRLITWQSSGSLEVGTLNLDGFAVTDSGGPYAAIACLLCVYVPGIGASQVNAANIDYTNISTLDAGNPYGAFPGITEPFAFGPPQLFNELPSGIHSIVASYTDDQNAPAVSSSPLIQVVQARTTSIALTSSANPAVANATLTLSCAVTGTDPIGGSVTFQEGARLIGTASVNKGVASITTATLLPGPHSITAIYTGDGVNSAVDSPALLQTIVQATAVALVSSQNPSLSLSPVTFSASVSNRSSVVPTGSVVFTDGQNIIGTAMLNSEGTVAVTSISLATGQSSVVASYVGDALNFPSSSAAIIQVTQLRATTVNLNLSVIDDQVTMASVLQAPGPVMPTGTISFLSNGTVIGIGTIDNTGKVSITITVASASIVVTAVYSGDSIYGSSSSMQASATKPPPFTISVNPSELSLESQQQGEALVALKNSSSVADTIDLQCLGVPEAMSCSFSSPQQVLTSNQSQAVRLIIDTRAPVTATSRVPLFTLGLSSMAWLFFSPLSWVVGVSLSKGRHLTKHSKLARLWAVALLAGVTAGLVGCGSQLSVGTPPGTYVIHVSATDETSGVTQTASLTVRITP